MIELERDPANADLLNSIFRTIHTIKGTCGFLGLDRLEYVSHAAESVLDLWRAGTVAASPDVVSDVLGAIDVIKLILEGISRTGLEPEGDDSLVIAALERHDLPREAEDQSSDARTCECPASRTDPGATRAVALANAPAESVLLGEACAASILAGAMPADAMPADAMPAGAIADGSRSGGATTLPVSETGAPSAASSLRVNVALLDSLMNLASELVLARNQLLQLVANDDNSVYSAPVQQLSRITGELQNAVMKTRMQPVSAAWSKLPRLVREIAREAGKHIELDMKGGETELDRQLVQALQDPLIHMVRNSADHGIELPHVRRATGKSGTGTIRLSAAHEGGQVTVEITDDGAGIDPAVVRRKAVQRGLVRAEVADAMTDRQVLRLLFEPGFSTADSITHLSGRGVGMDVVRDNVARVGGTVDVYSTPGQGCTTRVKLPLTLAVMPALLVGVDSELFALSQSCVVELVRLSAAQCGGFETVQGVPLYRLRGTLIPVLGLRGVLGLGRSTVQDITTLVICQAGRTRIGMVVDDVLDTQEIVVKPVSRRLRHLPCYAGSTILGDGRVVMILDPTGIASLSGMHATEQREAAAPAAVEPDRGGRDSILLFEGGSTGMQGVLLSDVARLEEIPLERLELCGDRWLVQYGGALLPVVPATPGLTVSAGTARSVIVFRHDSTSFGIAVHTIHDIVEDTVRMELPPSRPGVLGTAVIAGRATELLDPSYYMAQVRATARSQM